MARTVELVLRATYEREDCSTPSEGECEAALAAMVDAAANRGLLSGDSLLVSDYRYEVKTVAVD